MPPKKEDKKEASKRAEDNATETLSDDKTSLEDRLIAKYPKIIKRHPTQEGKYLCTPCDKNASKFSAGLWNNCEPHIFKSQTHFRVCSKLGLTLEGDEIESTHNNSQEAPKGNEASSANLESPSPFVNEELDFVLTKFILEYRLPFSMAKPLNDLIKFISKSYSLSCISEHSTSRDTITNITKVIGKTLKFDLLQDLRSSPFSLSVDSSSDIHGNTFFAICARFLDDDHDRPVVKLLQVIPITVSSTGEALFTKIEEEILKDEDIQQNFMGLASDDGKNMTGTNVGLAKRLKEKYGHIANVKDISHAWNNILKKGLKAIPAELMDIITGISSHFHHSTHRCSLLRDVLIQEKIKPREILHIAKTRWLTLRDALERILELWTGLEVYFKKYGTKSEKAYFTEENEGGLRILFVLVKTISDYNEFFQKDNLFYHEIAETLKEAFVTMANSILKKEAKTMNFDKIYNLPFQTKSNKDILANKFDPEVEKVLIAHDQFEATFLASYDSIKELLGKFKPEIKEKMITSAKKFLYLCLKNMKERLPYNNQEIRDSLIVYCEEDFDFEKWLKLKDSFPNILKTKKMRDDYVNEIKKIEYGYKKMQNQLQNTMEKMTPLTVWRNHAKTYPNAFEVAKAIFVLPYSSIPVERVFSALKDIKNKKRNRLTCENIEALLLGYQHFHSEKVKMTWDMLQEYLEFKEKKKKVLKPQKSGKSEQLVEVVSEAANHPNQDKDLNQILPDGENNMEFETKKVQRSSSKEDLLSEIPLEVRDLKTGETYDENRESGEENWDFEADCQWLDEIVCQQVPGSLKRKTVSPLPQLFQKKRNKKD